MTFAYDSVRRDLTVVHIQIQRPSATISPVSSGAQRHRDEHCGGDTLARIFGTVTLCALLMRAAVAFAQNPPPAQVPSTPLESPAVATQVAQAVAAHALV